MEVGERYIIEISDVIATNNGNLAKIKGFNALVFDENGLDKLEKAENYFSRDQVNEEKEFSYRNGKNVGYSEGYDKGFKDGVKHQGNMIPSEKEPHEPKEGDAYLSELGVLVIITHKGECGYAALWKDGSTGHYSAEKIKKWKLVSNTKVFLDNLESEVLA